MSGFHEKHAFVPSRKGSKDACGYGSGSNRCGARRSDPIHDVPHKPKETR